MAYNHDVGEIQIKSFKGDSVQQFWLFDGQGTTSSIANEVESLARRCRTVSPNAIKRDLYYQNRPQYVALFV